MRFMPPSVRSCVRASAFVAAWAFSAGALASPPPNDHCANALVIPGDDYTATVNAAEATTQSCEATAGACDAGSTHSVWWKFTPTQNGSIGASCYSSAFTSVLSVFDGCALMVLGGCVQPAALSCDVEFDEGYLDFASAYIDVQAGHTYLFRAASVNGASGMVNMSLYFTADVVNDDCSDATIISGGTFEDQFLINSADDDECETLPVSCATLPPANSAWYRYDAVAPGTLRLSTEGSIFDSIITVYHGCPLPLPNLGCAMPAQLLCAFGLANVGASADLPVVAGTSYVVRIASVGLFDGYLADFHAQFIPGNDTCGQARLIGFDTFNPAPMSIGGAGATLSEPLENCDGLFVSNSVFYRYTPSVDGAATINTFGSNYDTVLSVFDGCGQVILPSGWIQPTLLACHNDVGGLLGPVSALSNVPMLAGETYIIKVATNGSPAPEGVLDFNFQFTPTPACTADIAPAPAGDDAVNVSDLLAVINGWGACAAPCPPNCNADINDDCAVNVTDLLAVINAWGACP